MTTKTKLMACALAFAAFLAASCNGKLASNPDDIPVKYPLGGVDAANLEAKPLKSPIEAGKPVPVLRLEDQKGNLVSTRELTASRDALLIFSPGADSPEARPMYDWIRANRNMASGRGCEIVVVAPDVPSVNDQIAKAEELHVAILHDPSGWGARAFGLLSDNEATSVDSTWNVLIGKEGRVLETKPGLYAISDLVMTLSVRPDPRPYRAIDLLNQ
jgi:peroxiredoxin